jgi:hypothetical protein
VCAYFADPSSPKNPYWTNSITFAFANAGLLKEENPSEKFLGRFFFL